MILDEVLEHNRVFVRGREPKPLPTEDAVKLAVVACHDPRLDGVLYASLGLAPGEVAFFRTAGAHVPPSGDPLRSIALAAFRYGIEEVLVVGHTSCRMAAFDTSAFIDAFRRRGVAREAFGSEDLRRFVGASADPKRGVLASIAALEATAYLPRELRISGLVLDDTTGALEVVRRPGEPVQAVPALEPAAASPPPPTPTVTGPSAPPAGAGPPTPTVAPPAIQGPLAQALHRLVTTLEAKAAYPDEVARLRQQLGKTSNPLLQVRLLEEFFRHSRTDVAEIQGAFEELRRQAAASRLGRAWSADLAEWLRRGSREG